jgi:hypothetical protein
VGPPSALDAVVNWSPHAAATTTTLTAQTLEKANDLTRILIS